MKRLIIFLIVSVIISITFSSCVALSVNFTASSEKRAPKPSDAYVFVLSPKDSLPKGTIVLGKITVRDGGLTTRCDLPDVIAAAKKQAREVGADAIKISEINPPDFWSTCWRIDAIAVVLDRADTIGMRASEVLPNLDFLKFSEMSPCQDYGNLDSIKSKTFQIFPLPFLCRTKYENRAEGVRYPATQAKINEYFSAELKSKYKCIDVNLIDTSVTHKIWNEFIVAVLDNVSNGKGLPLQWGHPFPSAIVDSNTVIYFPVGIERESAETVQARFYVLIFDYAGQAIFSRCMPYRPDKWSEKIENFKNDVSGKLPLLENK